MRQTLFHIPPEVFGVPTLGFGWVLALWVVISIVLAIPIAKEQGWQSAIAGMLPYLAIGAAVIIFVLPNIEEASLTDPSVNLGLPIRGYGVAMFFSVTSGVWLALRGARRVGLHDDVIYSLAMWMFVLGFAGARLFYLIQKRDEMRAESWVEYLGNAINITQGGLVVYGSLIGAMIAYAVFAYRHRLPHLVIGDILAPAMLFGLSIGRLGCLLNGCCYGGVCDHPWAVQFPINSPPYMDQMQSGLGQGIYLGLNADGEAEVRSILPDSPAAIAGLKAGDVIQSLTSGNLGKGPVVAAGAITTDTRIRLNSAPNTAMSAKLEDGRTVEWQSTMTPKHSFPIHPTQIYSSLNALLLFLVIMAIRPFQRRDGLLFAITMTAYPITRFMLEIVRTDEAPINSAGFTISQTVSFFIIAAAVGLWIMVYRQPAGRQRLVAR
ncbi:MAG: prolipoprotein diacylglyceryl transferase family protein [Planctomycetota bacterium]